MHRLEQRSFRFSLKLHRHARLLGVLNYEGASTDSAKFNVVVAYFRRESPLVCGDCHHHLVSSISCFFWNPPLHVTPVRACIEKWASRRIFSPLQKFPHSEFAIATNNILMIFWCRSLWRSCSIEVSFSSVVLLTRSSQHFAVHSARLELARAP